MKGEDPHAYFCQLDKCKELFLLHRGDIQEYKATGNITGL